MQINYDSYKLELDFITAGQKITRQKMEQNKQTGY